MFSPVTLDCWWCLSQCRTAVCRKSHGATDTTACRQCAGNILVPKLCCSALGASMAKAWWDCLSLKTHLQRVCGIKSRSGRGQVYAPNVRKSPNRIRVGAEMSFAHSYALLLSPSPAPAASSESSSSLEQEKYLQAILNSIPVYFKSNSSNTLSNRSLVGLSPGIPLSDGTHPSRSGVICLQKDRLHVCPTLVLACVVPVLRPVLGSYLRMASSHCPNCYLYLWA